MSLSTRIKHALREAGITQADLAREAGVTPQGVYGWVSGGTQSLTGESLLKAAKALGVRPEWLASGSGAMRNPSHAHQAAGPGLTAYQDANELDPNKYVWVKRYDVSLSAGTGSPVWVEQEDDPIAFRAAFFARKGLTARNCRAMYVRGRSMEPRLDDGDTVVIDTSQTRVIEGEIYALMVGDQLYIKHLEPSMGGLMLRSSNPAFADRQLSADELAHTTILGRAVWRGG